MSITEAKYIRGTAALEMGRLDEAHTILKEALENNKYYNEARYNLSLVELLKQQTPVNTELSISLDVASNWELSVFAAHAYSDTGGEVLPAGWQRIFDAKDVSDRDGPSARDGFYAVAFANLQRTEVVVAFRGTETYLDLLTSVQVLTLTLIVFMRSKIQIIFSCSIYGASLIATWLRRSTSSSPCCTGENFIVRAHCSL